MTAEARRQAACKATLPRNFVAQAKSCSSSNKHSSSFTNLVPLSHVLRLLCICSVNVGIHVHARVWVACVCVYGEARHALLNCSLPYFLTEGFSEPSLAGCLESHRITHTHTTIPGFFEWLLETQIQVFILEWLRFYQLRDLSSTSLRILFKKLLTGVETQVCKPSTWEAWAGFRFSGRSGL